MSKRVAGESKKDTIKPVDRPGVHTVTLCGPGGCGDQQNERKTFNKGDKRYNIMSATVMQVGRAENRSTCKQKSKTGADALIFKMRS